MEKRLSGWKRELSRCYDRIAGLFARSEARERSLGYLQGLLSHCELRWLRLYGQVFRFFKWKDYSVSRRGGGSIPGRESVRPGLSADVWSYKTGSKRRSCVRLRRPTRRRAGRRVRI